MARIRTLKPEFWQDEKLAPLDALTRLVFIGLISQADDAGRLVDSPKLIDGLLFPFTDDTSAMSLRKLSDVGVIRRGRTASGQAIIQIVNWHHQKVDKPNLKGALPPITKETPSVSDDSAKDRRKIGDEPPNHTNDLRPTTNDLNSNGSKDPTAAPPKNEKETDPDKELHRLRSAAVPLIQTHLWLGDKPPKPGWHKGRDLSIWNEMLKQFSPHEINGAITVCRTVVHEEIGMRPITMEYFNAEGKRDRMSRCVAAWRQSETRKLAAERRGLRLIGDDLEEVVRAAAG